jgi:cyclic beta-1,2-glucan synthetase
VSLELQQVVDPADPVKVARLTIRNSGSLAAKFTVYAYAEWVLGNNRPRSAPNVVPALDAETGALLASNPYSLDFADRVAFLASDTAAQSVTTDRGEFLGQDGTVEWPQAVTAGAALSGKVEAGLDPCAAMAREVEIPAGGEVSLLWLMGDAGSAEEAGALVARHRARDFDERLADNERTWRGFLDTLQVETPDKALDAMVNHWLPYQSIACRITRALGFLSGQRRVRLSRSVAGHAGSIAARLLACPRRRSSTRRDASSWRATCSTGGCRRNGAGVRTMISDDVVWLALRDRAAMSQSPAMTRFSTRLCRSSRRAGC